MWVRLQRLLLVGAVLAPLCGAGVARAADDPSQFVASFLDEAFGLFHKQSITVPQRHDALSDLFATRMDIAHMARFMTMGRVSDVSPEERQRFEQLLVNYLVDTFYAKIAKGAGAPFDVSQPDAAAERNDVAVNSIIKKPGSPPEQVTWRLRQTDGSYKIVDVISEGISLADTHRAVFASVMQNGGLPRLEEILAAR